MFNSGLTTNTQQFRNLFANSHPGSWFGLPDLGITERLTSNKTNQGGSDIVRPYNQSANYTPSPVPTNYNPFAAPTPTTTAPKTNTNGTVLGTTTAYKPPTPTTAPTQNQTQNPQQPNNPQDPIAAGIQDNYSEVRSQLDKLIGFLPEEQAALEQRIKDLATGQLTTAQQAGDAELAKFDGYRTNVTTTQNKSLRDLAENTRNILMSANNYLGGSSNSSATPLIQTAVTKDVNKNRANVMAQSRQMMQELDVKESDVRTNIQSQVSQIETWRDTQISQIAETFQNRLNELRSQGLDMSFQERQELLNRLREVESETKNYSNMIAEAGLSRLQALNDYKLQLSQLSDFNPQDIVNSELAFLPNAMQQGTELANSVFGYKKDEKYK